MTQAFNMADLSTALPEVVLSLVAMAILMLDFIAPKGRRDWLGYLSVLGVLLTLMVLIPQWGATQSAFSGQYLSDPFALFFKILFLAAAGLIILMSIGYLRGEGADRGEFYALILFATLGMMLMASAVDLLILYIGLEMMSISIYVLAGFLKRERRSNEAALKYLLMGGFSSAIILYGMVILYGLTGATGLKEIASALTADTLSNPALILAMVMLAAGFGFKIAAVPFHMWAPDVYDGAPTPVTAFMATGVKAAAFAALFRVMVQAFAAVPAWHDIVWWLAVVTMIGGNLFALGQRSFKRMLAYSSVAHAGYLLVALTAGGRVGTSAFIVYVIAYTLMSFGAFAVLAAKGRGGESDVTIDDLAGLAGRRPWLAFALAICMLSLLGFPGTAGFIGKWYIIMAAIGAGQTILATILVLTSVVSAGYYLPVIMAMYMKPEPIEAAHVDAVLDRWGRAAVAVVVAGLLLFGVWPNRLFDLARSAGDSVQPTATTTTSGQ